MPHQLSVSQRPVLAAAGSLMPIDLDAVSARHLTRTWSGPLRPQLLVDCGRLHCLRTLGVSHVVNELLILHQAGARVWLRNASPVLHHCLRLLRLEALFPNVE